MDQVDHLEQDQIHSRRPPLVIVAGPTAVGKSAAAISLAKDLGGGIVSADSMQVYRGMDIGTAKVTPEERAQVPHALIDIVDPMDNWNVVLFQQRAKAAIADFRAQGLLPILCGGTGFYIQALLYDIDFSENTEDPAYRRELEEEADRQGAVWLHGILAQTDPAAAAQIPVGNVRRVIRALEYYHVTGSRISDHNEEQHRRPAVYDAVYFVLTMERAKLYQRIDARVDQMMAEGLVDEVRRLKAAGLDEHTQSMQGLGYRQILAYLDGNCSLDEAVAAVKNETRHFAKRQETWFRREAKRNPSLIFVDPDRFGSREEMVSRMEAAVHVRLNSV